MSTFNPAPKPVAKEKPAKPTRRRKAVRRINHERQARTRDRAYLDWVKTQNCVVLGRVGICAWWVERPDTEPAHIKTKGSGGADRGNVVPLCPLHHSEQEGDTEGFEQTYGLNLKLEAARLLVKFIEAGND